jgi:hypothetical protein
MIDGRQCLGRDLDIGAGMRAQRRDDARSHGAARA